MRGSTDRADELAFEDPKNNAQIVPPFQDLSVHPNHCVLALPAAQLRTFLDLAERMFGRSANHRENRDIPEAGNAVVAPFSGSDHATIERQDDTKLCPVKRNLGRYLIAGKRCETVHPPTVAARASQIKRFERQRTVQPAREA